MNNFDEWSQIISKFLKAEADLLTSVTKHDIAADSTRAAFIRGVLEPFLPSSYAIGSGRVIDSEGNNSDDIDIVIYRRDFPRLNLPGSSDVFLYESVLATIEVRTKLIRKTLFDALNTCASLAKLNPEISPQILKNIAAQNKMTLNDQNNYVHEHPLLTDRFRLIGRPPSFIYGFNGFQTSPGQLNDNINIWIEQRKNDNLAIDLNAFPAVIATQGCIGWRNAAPLSANNNHLFGIGADTAPVRLIVFQLLYQLNRRLKVTPDGYGLKPSVDAYLKKMAPPEIQHTIGKATHATRVAAKAEETAPLVKKADAPARKVANSPAPKPQPTTESKPVPQARPTTETKPVTSPETTTETRSTAETKPVTAAKTATEARPAVESKPAPVQKVAEKAKPAPEALAAAEPRPAAEPKPAAKPEPAPEALAAAEPRPAAEPKPAAKPEPAPEPKVTFDSPLRSRPAPKPETETAPETRASGIQKPALGSMYHADPTLAEMPVPDARLVPEPEAEPESESFIVTKPASQPIKPATETKKAADPDPKSDPFIETVKVSNSESKPASKPAIPAVEPEPEPEADEDPFLQTVRIPASAMPKPPSEPKSDPFGQTIPGLPDHPKSVH